MASVTSGLENLILHSHPWVKDTRIGLLCNPASVDSQYRHAKHLVDRLCPGRLTTLFSPQHGIFAEKQDNMVESHHTVDRDLGIPVFSLYGETRIPTPEMLDPIDLLIIDLLDVGTRVYTFTSTLSYCLETAAKLKKRVLVLDRPNPVGGLQVEGNLLRPELSSFVGRYPIPMRHGLTMGEYALYINTTFRIHCVLDVVPMTGWDRRMYFSDTGLPWVLPSPNLPTPDAAVVYPGQVIWEGTNISEGRGTTLPFEQFGAPFVDLGKLRAFMGETPGAVLRPVAFEPTSNKWAGQVCVGFQVHVTDRQRFSPYETSLKLLQGLLRNHQDAFLYKTPPYEYEWEKRPIDMILGDADVRRRLENGEDPADLARAWADELAAYRSETAKFFLYK